MKQTLVLAREQLGTEVRQAVRDLLCDENFDQSAAPRYRLDFEWHSVPSGGLRVFGWLLERHALWRWLLIRQAV